MKEKIAITLLSMLLLNQTAFPVLADSRQRSFSLSLTGGFLTNTTFGKFVPLPNTADVPEIAVSWENRGISFGLSFGYALDERFKLEGSFTYGRSDIFNTVGIGLAGISLGKTKVADSYNMTYNINILFHLTRNRISPFVTAGFGVISLRPDELRSNTSLLFNYGVGAKLKFSPELAVRVDLKDYVSFFNYPRDFDVASIAIYSHDFKQTQHRVGLSLGLSYSF